MDGFVDCEFLAACPIFAHFKSEGLKNTWVSLYCKGSKQPFCSRKILRDEGKEVPVTLLPNGRHLDVLSNDS